MKMKEVCSLTGLTERTIRFYVEKKLITPQTTIQNDRTYAEYTAADVDTLRNIAVLRRMLFSLEEIAQIQRSPKTIPQILTEYRERIEAESELRTEILAIDPEILRQSKNLGELARAMRIVSQHRQLPQTDIEPDFSKMDDEKPIDPEQAAKEFWAGRERLVERGMIYLLIITVIEVGLAIVSLFTGGGLFKTIFSIVVALCLFSGQNWARIFFIIASGFSSFVGFMVLVHTLQTFGMSHLPLLVFFVVELIYCVVVCIALFKSKAIQEYMYNRQN